MTMWLKGCPKCRGDVFEEPALGAHSAGLRFLTCLQCGHLLTDQEEQLVRRDPRDPRLIRRIRVA